MKNMDWYILVTWQISIMLVVVFYIFYKILII